MKPVLHITNHSSRRLHGPGRLWTIMARPRHFERGRGTVRAFVPLPADLDAVRAGRLSHDEYRDRCAAHFRRFDVAPGALWAEDASTAAELVVDGDTLCCACSREAAARGECHRVVAARLLSEAGWNVILDGVSP